MKPLTHSRNPPNHTINISYTHTYCTHICILFFAAAVGTLHKSSTSDLISLLNMPTFYQQQLLESKGNCGFFPLPFPPEKVYGAAPWLLVFPRWPLLSFCKFWIKWKCGVSGCVCSHCPTVDITHCSLYSLWASQNSHASWHQTFTFQASTQK